MRHAHRRARRRVRGNGRRIVLILVVFERPVRRAREPRARGRDSRPERVQAPVRLPAEQKLRPARARLPRLRGGEPRRAQRAQRGRKRLLDLLDLLDFFRIREGGVRGFRVRGALRPALHDQDGVSGRPGSVERSDPSPSGRVRPGRLVPGELGDVGRPRDVQVTPAARVPRVRHHRVHGRVQDDRLRGIALVRDARGAGERALRGGELLFRDVARDVVAIGRTGHRSRRNALLSHRDAHRRTRPRLSSTCAAIGGSPRNGTRRVRPGRSARRSTSLHAPHRTHSRQGEAPVEVSLAPPRARTRLDSPVGPPGRPGSRSPLTPRRDHRHRTCRTKTHATAVSEKTTERRAVRKESVNFCKNRKRS